MGVRGLSTYILEHLSSVLEQHMLHNRHVIIDGNNLAHILYYECTGINAAFGGDYDKYASFVQGFFERLQSCEVHAIVIMDGGQPLKDRKMRTVKERVVNQIRTCLSIQPSNQYRLKLFPCMGSQVFVTTLQKMGITVLQTDFEADEEIAQLAKKLGLTVLSNDSDFYVFNVPFILLDSIRHKKVRTGKKKKSRETFKYMTCCHFNLDIFCKETGMDPEHLPLLATLLGNDYLAFDVFTDFYAHLGDGKRNRNMTARHKTIRNVISWLASKKGRTTDDVITDVVSIIKGKKIRRKILQSLNNYTCLKTNLLNLILAESSLKSLLEKVITSDSSLLDDSSKTERLECETERHECETKVHNVKPEFETALILKSGKELPAWFVEAYRMYRIPHEVADILTQSYFISPPQIEDGLSDCSYLVVEPIVRSVYTLLWKGVRTHQIVKRFKVIYEKDDFKVSEIQVEENLDEASLRECDEYDSDVVVEEDSDEDWDHEIEKMSQPEEDKELEESEVSTEDEMIRGLESNMDQLCVKGDESTSEVEESCNGLLKTRKRARRFCLKWYLRKRKGLHVRRISYLPSKGATSLPSLNQVGSLSVADKKKVFYNMLGSDTEFMDLDLPNDLELILDFIIYWFRRSNMSLIDCHALAVLLCVFMYYIIDGKIGRVRTWKAFEDVERCKTVVAVLRDSSAYCNPSADVVDLLTHISNEECLIASYNLFKFHHMNQKINDKYYSRRTVHAFSEYQACIYFMQLLNSLLCSPFPMLSVECLWGGTFCYNIFYDLKKRDNPLFRITELLGRGTCLEKLFLKLFKKLGEVLNFKKFSHMLEAFKNVQGSQKRNKKKKKIASTAKNEGNKIISERREKGVDKHKTSANSDVHVSLKSKEKVSVKQKAQKAKSNTEIKEVVEKKEQKNASREQTGKNERKNSQTNQASKNDCKQKTKKKGKMPKN